MAQSTEDVVVELLDIEAFYDEWTHWYAEGFGARPDLKSPADAGILVSMLGPGWSIYHHTEGHWVVNTLLASGPSRAGATLGEAAARALLAKLRREDP